jgi:hypothetical protein
MATQPASTGFPTVSRSFVAPTDDTVDKRKV